MSIIIGKENIQTFATLAYAGEEYWRAVNVLVKDLKNKDSDNNFFWVLLPMMHMSIELFLKAIVLLDDKTFDCKLYGHNTQKLINTYSNKIDTLNFIKNDQTKMNLIISLEKSWTKIRYAESVIIYDYTDIELFEEIIALLYNKYLSTYHLKYKK